MGRIIRITEDQFQNIIKRLVEQNAPLDELTHEEFKNSPRLQELRNAINKNKIVGVAYVKKDGSVRAMCFRKYLKSYVASERPKSDAQLAMNETHNQISVIDLNVYNKALRENGGDKEAAAKQSWRKINLETVLGFIAGENFIDLRGPEDNNILERFGEEVNNSLTKSMVNIIERNRAENAMAVEEPDAPENMEEPENPEGGVLEIPEQEEFHNDESPRETAMTLLRAMRRDLDRVTSGNVAHVRMSLMGGVDYVLELVETEWKDCNETHTE